MRNEQIAVLASLRRSQQFLDAHVDVLDAVNKSSRKQLDDVVTQLSDLSVAQESGTRASKGETARQRSLLLALRRNYMTPVAELAKLKLREVPEFAALMLPPSDSTAQRVVAAAYSMADAAGAHADILIGDGLPATFADDLRSAAAAVSDSLSDRGEHQGRRVGATAGLIAEDKRGRAMLRVLNALVMARIGSDPQLVAEWGSAKVVRRKPGPAAGSRPTDVTPIHAVVAPTQTPVSVVVPVTAPAAVAA